MYGKDSASVQEIAEVIKALTTTLQTADSNIISSVYYTSEETNTKFGIVDFKIKSSKGVFNRGVELRSASTINIINQIVAVFDEYNLAEQFMTVSREKAVGMSIVRKEQKGAFV